MIQRITLALLLACISRVAHGQTGLIIGTYLNESGGPIAKGDAFAMFYRHCAISDERVRANIESGSGDACLSKSDGRVDANTNEAGVFELQRLKWGVYKLTVQKSEDGYCYDSREPSWIVLTPETPDARIILQRPRCALITGKIRNAKTGKLISGVTLRLRFKNHPESCTVMGTTTPIHQLIPPQEDFTLAVWAEGFKTKTYRATFDASVAKGEPATRLNLQPGETLNLDVALAPLSRPEPLKCPGDDNEENSE